jgi:hypothetical protein
MEGMKNPKSSYVITFFSSTNAIVRNLAPKIN